MLTRLLRRLQGQPAIPGAIGANAPAGTDDAIEHATASDDGHEALPADVLASAFVRHLLGTAPGAPVVAGLADDMGMRLEALAERLDVARLPRLPALVPQLLATMRRDDADAASLATLLSRDATLAGEVMRVANSAHYRRGAPISALQQAVGAIGNEGLRYAVLTSVMRPILHADPSHQGAEAGARLAAYSEARTWLCGALDAQGEDPAEVQLGSVIASTGLAALLRMMPRPLLAQAAADDAFASRLLELAGELSARAAAHWRLGEPLQQALRAFPSGGGTVRVGRVLATADRLAMLHVLTVAGLVDAGTHVATDARERRRDARLLEALRVIDADALAA